MAQKTLEERVEQIESQMQKINGYGKIAMGAFGALSVVGAALNWIIDKIMRLHQ